MKMPPVIILDGGNDLGGNSTPDANCGARSKTAMKVAPDILIVLDRSGSMNDDINNQMCRPDGGGGGRPGLRRAVQVGADDPRDHAGGHRDRRGRQLGAQVLPG